MLTPSVLVVRTTLAGADTEGLGAVNDPDLLAVVEGGGDRAAAGDAAPEPDSLFTPEARDFAASLRVRARSLEHG